MTNRNGEIIYKIGGLKRPNFNYFQRKVLYLNKIPFIRNISFIKKCIYKIYNIPISTSISKDFYCSSSNMKIGNNVGLSDTYILSYAPVIIGNNCSFSFRNMIITSSHDYENFSTVIAKPIIIEENVWITTNVIILPGVKIGNNSVIGAGSVVTHDIPSGVFAAGNPCKVIRNIILNK